MLYQTHLCTSAVNHSAIYCSLDLSFLYLESWQFIGCAQYCSNLQSVNRLFNKKKKKKRALYRYCMAQVYQNQFFSFTI